MPNHRAIVRYGLCKATTTCRVYKYADLSEHKSVEFVLYFQVTVYYRYMSSNVIQGIAIRGYSMHCDSIFHLFFLFVRDLERSKVSLYPIVRPSSVSSIKG